MDNGPRIGVLKAMRPTRPDTVHSICSLPTHSQNERPMPSTLRRQRDGRGAMHHLLCNGTPSRAAPSASRRRLAASSGNHLTKPRIVGFHHRRTERLRECRELRGDGRAQPCHVQTRSVRIKQQRYGWAACCNAGTHAHGACWDVDVHTLACLLLCCAWHRFRDGTGGLACLGPGEAQGRPSEQW